MPDSYEPTAAALLGREALGEADELAKRARTRAVGRAQTAWNSAAFPRNRALPRTPTAQTQKQRPQTRRSLLYTSNSSWRRSAGRWVGADLTGSIPVHLVLDLSMFGAKRGRRHYR